MPNSASRLRDVATLDSIILATYDVISGPAGGARDWDRMRNLFCEGARLMPIVAVPGEAPRVRLLSVEDYIRRVEPIFANEGFWERETGRQVETFGRVAHVLSRYESFHTPDGAAFDRGTNSMQLFYDDTRWWVVSVMWNTARAA